MPKIKCAIYVRKSTEHGLDQKFNSLDNQELSCKAYIASQAFNDWEYYKTYADGGISGGTMERPALKQMLDDMAHGLVNTVVVYKVDRLSRSILDFHNMMKYFEKYGVNFVSITQSFDTSTSMGKLTLNMLLSFAQFEREVSSERVRDKLRASKAKGLWIGGFPPLGYDVINKKLVVNETEAAQVRTIFELYLQMKSVDGLARYLPTIGIMAKRWTTRKGRVLGGRPLKIMSLHRILHSKTYLGYVECKVTGTTARGEHAPIISQELFDAAQRELANNTHCKSGRTAGLPNLLSGRLYNSNGTKFINQSTVRPHRPTLYYYAVTGTYLAAGDVDKLATDTICEFMNADLESVPATFVQTIKQIDYNALDYMARRKLIQTLITRAIYASGQITFFINAVPDALRPFIRADYINTQSNKTDFIQNNGEIILTRKIVINRHGDTNKYSLPHKSLMTKTDNNNLIVRAFTTAWKYRTIYEQSGDLGQVVKSEHTSWRSLYRYLNLAYMHPEKVNNILSGKESYSMDELFAIAPKNQI